MNTMNLFWKMLQVDTYALSGLCVIYVWTTTLNILYTEILVFQKSSIFFGLLVFVTAKSKVLDFYCCDSYVSVEN